MNQLFTAKWRIVRSDDVVDGTAGIVGYEGLGGIRGGLQGICPGRGRYRRMAERGIRRFNPRRRRSSTRQVRPEWLQNEALKQGRAEIQAHDESNAQDCRNGLPPSLCSGDAISA